jgi:hypothetical protein
MTATPRTPTGDPAFRRALRDLETFLRAHEASDPRQVERALALALRNVRTAREAPIRDLAAGGFRLGDL